MTARPDGVTDGPCDRMRSRRPRHHRPMGRARGRLLAGVAVTLITIATTGVATLGPRSTGVTLACAVTFLAAWSAIER